MFEYPTVQDFKNYFFRDFPYSTGTCDESKIVTKDIEKAMVEAKFNFNPALFGTQEQFTVGFLYLTAHYLVTDLRNSSQGLAGKYTWLSQSKSVGSVSESYGIPPRILENPYMAMLTQTNYGAKYISLLLPQLIGNVFVVCGKTHA